MKTILILLLLSTTCWGQTQKGTAQPESFSVNFYRLNPIRLELQYPVGSVSTVSAVFRKGRGQSNFSQQPAIVDSTSSGVTLYWPSGQNLPDAGYLEVSLNNYVVATGTLYIDYGDRSTIGSNVLRFAPTGQSAILRFAEPAEPLNAVYLWKQLMAIILN